MRAGGYREQQIMIKALTHMEDLLGLPLHPNVYTVSCLYCYSSGDEQLEDTSRNAMCDVHTVHTVLLFPLSLPKRYRRMPTNYSSRQIRHTQAARGLTHFTSTRLIVFLPHESTTQG